MHKVYFEIRYIEQWYQIIKELKKSLGGNDDASEEKERKNKIDREKITFNF